MSKVAWHNPTHRYHKHQSVRELLAVKLAPELNYRETWAPEGSRLAEYVETKMGLLCHMSADKHVHVYRSDDKFVRGSFWYADERSVNDSFYVPTWNICAQHVRNGKHDARSRSFNRISTRSFDRACKEVSKHFCKYTVSELVVATASKAYNAQDALFTEAKLELDKACKKALNNTWMHSVTLLREELRKLVEDGYEFRPIFHQNVLALLEQEDNMEDLKRRTQEHTFVNYYMKGETEWFDVVNVGLLDDVNDMVSWKSDHTASEYLDELSTKKKRCKEDMLSADMIEKLSLLHMCEVDDYLHGVGVKVGEGMYYVAN